MVSLAFKVVYPPMSHAGVWFHVSFLDSQQTVELEMAGIQAYKLCSPHSIHRLYPP